jgi:hypothetical protein
LSASRHEQSIILVHHREGAFVGCACCQGRRTSSSAGGFPKVLDSLSGSSHGSLGASLRTVVHRHMLLKGVLSHPRPIPRIVQRLHQPAEISLEGGLGSAEVIVFPFGLVHQRCCFHKFFGERGALRAWGIVWADQAAMVPTRSSSLKVQGAARPPHGWQVH